MKNATKRLLTILLAAGMAFSLAACGDKKEDAGNSGAASSVPENSGVSSTPKALTEEEYKTHLEETLSKLERVNNADITDADIEKLVMEDVEYVSRADADAVKKELENMKAEMNGFIALNPPQSYKDGHDKLSSGCQAMIDYIDTALRIIGEADQDKISDASAKMMKNIKNAVTDITEGAALLDEALNK